MDSDSSRRTDVAIESGPWREAVADIEGHCERIVTAVLRAQAPELAGIVEVSIVLTDDDAVRALNRTWRGKDQPTNVLSFPVQDGLPELAHPGGAPLLLGDIVLAFETVAREAGDAARPLADHLAHLLVHGTLHLLGLDHVEAEQAESMERCEIRILAGLGVADPYRGELAT